MIGLPAAYGLAGLLFATYAWVCLRRPAQRRRLSTTGFFTLLALSFLAGDRLGDVGNGLLALGLIAFALIGVAPAAQTPEEDAREQVRREAGAARHGDHLFVLALVVPLVALIGALALKDLRLGATPLVDPKQATVIALALAVLVALALASAVLRARPSEALEAGGRLSQAVGWPLILPQMLAALGAVFALAGVGRAVSAMAHGLPLGGPFAAVAAYTIGMAAFTVVMGNTFAAFPVMTAGIGWPLIVQKLHGDPAIMGALGMLSGFCGTLLTPMAANFNVVPVGLLGLRDRWAVIRVQAPTALALLAINTGLMYALVFRF